MGYVRFLLLAFRCTARELLSGRVHVSVSRIVLRGYGRFAPGIAFDVCTVVDGNDQASLNSRKRPSSTACIRPCHLMQRSDRLTRIYSSFHS